MATHENEDKKHIPYSKRAKKKIIGFEHGKRQAIVKNAFTDIINGP